MLVRDAFLSNPSQVEQMRNLDMPFTEVKTEVQIDRLTSAANPRVFERVPAGAQFEFELMLNVFEDDNEQGHCSTSTILAGRRQLFLPIAARLMFDQLLLSPTPFIGGDVDGRDPLRGPTINVASRPVSPASRPSFRRLRWARSVGVFACDSSAR